MDGESVEGAQRGKKRVQVEEKAHKRDRGNEDKGMDVGLLTRDEVIAMIYDDIIGIELVAPEFDPEKSEKGR